MAAKYAPGLKAVGICMRCSKKCARRDMLVDGYYPNLIVCSDCFDTRHPQERLPRINDPTTIYKPAPDDIGDPPLLSVELASSGPATIAMGGVIQFTAKAIGNIAGSIARGIALFQDSAIFGSPTNDLAGILLNAGTLADYGDLIIYSSGETGGQLQIELRVPLAEARATPQTAYWTTLSIPGYAGGFLQNASSAVFYQSTDATYAYFGWVYFTGASFNVDTDYTATFTPIVAASDGETSAHLTWTEAAPINARIDSYDVYRRVGAAVDFTFLVTLPITYDIFMAIVDQDLEYDDAAMTPGEVHEYYVVANTDPQGPDVLTSNRVQVTADAIETFFRLLEDGSFRLMEIDGTARRLLQEAP